MSPTRAVRLNGWKRLGIVLSAFWLVGSAALVAGDYLSGNSTFARYRLIDRDTAGAVHNKDGGKRDLFDEFGVDPAAAKRGAFDDLVPAAPASVTWGANDRKASTADVREQPARRRRVTAPDDKWWEAAPLADDGQRDAIVRELNYRAVFLVVFVPVLVAWALASVLVFSFQWVRAGFRDRAETTRQ